MAGINYPEEDLTLTRAVLPKTGLLMAPRGKRRIEEELSGFWSDVLAPPKWKKRSR